LIPQKLVRLLNNYFRKELDVFTTKEVLSFLKKNKIKISEDELLLLMDSISFVVPLTNHRFITRAGIFTGMPFAIKPSRYEIENNILIIGDRFMPFVDPEILPHDLIIKFLGRTIKHKVVSIPSGYVIDAYKFYGEEFIPQVISMDKANNELDYAKNDYMIPGIVNLTVLDMSSFYKFFRFVYGQRICAVVSDWDAGEIEIVPSFTNKENPFEETSQDKRLQKWFKNAEKALLETFDKYGACNSIDEQLTFMFLEHRNELALPDCGSLEELFDKSEKVEISYFGVETRLWKKGEEIPIYPSLNEKDQFENDNSNETLDNQKNVLPYNDKLYVPSQILDAFIYDSLFKKNDNVESIMKQLFPDSSMYSKREISQFLLHLQKKRDILSKDYNWFADNDIGEIRHSVLDLYLRLVDLQTELSYLGKHIDNVAQRPLVVFSQLAEHVTRLVVTFSSMTCLSDEEIAAISVSLEGMELSYEETVEVLVDEIKKHQKDIFSIIKGD
jgi:hypothetical protein